MADKIEERALTPDEIVNTLADGKAATLIGALETGQVDFKREPYRLGSESEWTREHDKYELAKDVSCWRTPTEG